MSLLHGKVQRGFLSPWAKPVLWLLCAAPMGWLLWAGYTDQLGANPAEAMIRGLGDWALRLLCATLTVTPLRVVTGLNALARLRRMLGLWTFAYAALHLLAYAWLDMGLEWPDMAADVVKRPFIAVGMLNGLILLALAVTSPNRVVRALGATRWQALHRSVYAAAILVLLHFYWMRAGKNDTDEVLWYGALVTLLLGWRLWRRWRASASD